MNKILHFIIQIIQDGWGKGCVLGISRRLEQTGRLGLRNLPIELYPKGKRKPVSASGKTET